VSDFLSRLTERRQRPADAVRPRVRSMFEDGGATPSRGLGAQEEVVETEAAQPAMKAAAAIPAPQQASVAPAPRHRETTAHMETNLHSAPVFETASAPPELPDPRPSGPAPFAPAPALAAHEPATPVDAPAARQPAEASGTPEPAIVRAEQRADAPVRIERIETQVVVHGNGPPPAIPAPIAVAPFAPPPFAPAREANAPRAPAPRREPGAKPAQPEPVIHVTIGRVEIRAVAEREPARRKREAASAVMSLDDYLRARSKR